MGKARDLAKPLRHEVGFHVAVLANEVKAAPTEGNPPAERLLDRFDERLGLLRARPAQRRSAEGDARVVIGLVEGELSVLISGGKASVHRQDLARGQEDRRSLALPRRCADLDWRLSRACIEGQLDRARRAFDGDRALALPLPAADEAAHESVVRLEYMGELLVEPEVEGHRGPGLLEGLERRKSAFIVCDLPVALVPRRTLIPGESSSSTSLNTLNSRRARLWIFIVLYAMVPLNHPSVE
jgi:hypothetical protein